MTTEQMMEVIQKHKFSKPIVYERRSSEGTPADRSVGLDFAVNGLHEATRANIAARALEYDIPVRAGDLAVGHVMAEQPAVLH